jgi:hypothetical protein
MMEFLYDTDQEREAFGEHFCGPERLPHGEEVLVAKYPKTPPDGDGQSVEVYCLAMPARFYVLRVAPEPNGFGKAQQGCTVSTGSSMRELAHLMAAAFSTGMLGVDVIEGAQS